MATIAVLGTLDTKGHEHAFVAKLIQRRGHRPLLIDVGTGGPPQVAPDITRAEVAAAGGIDLAAAVASGDRGTCVAAMAAAAPQLIERLHREGRIDAAVALGGGGGTAIAAAALKSLPLGVPKLIVSTLASGDTAPYVGTSDLVMMPAIVDICGLNRVLRTVLARAAGAICGMVEADVDRVAERPLIVASMFGNTTACVTEARRLLEEAGYEVLVFHATGAGGRAMESLIESGMVAGVLDLTTTELADELVGGILSAGPDRCGAAARQGVPVVLAPGCLDMVNFGSPPSVPARFSGRRVYAHNPQVTLLRTTAEECAVLGRQLAEKANACRGPVSVFLPRGGISIIAAPGGPFHDAAADAALFGAIRGHLRPGLPLVEMDVAINEQAFARACVDALLAMLRHAPVPAT
jgi:uncharacterized protein (UPF0261 family)